MGMGNLAAAEKWMKKVLNQHPDHKSAATALPMVQEQLKRSPTTLKSSWKRAQSVDPNNQFAKDYLLARPKKKGKKKSNVSDFPIKNQSTLPVPKNISLESISISPRLATFTLVNVLKQQGLYHQALVVLDILDKKRENKKRIANERKAIKAEL